MSKLTQVRLVVLLALGFCGSAAFSVEHNLFSKAEFDEAMDAKIHGAMTQAEVDMMMQGASDDYFAKMDYGITLPPNQEKLRAQLDPFIPGITAAEAAQRVARGRNNWIVWTAGNDAFWNGMTRATFGGLDFLKTISDHPALPSNRDNRWLVNGLVNEPCFTKGTGPREDRWGLWLPTRIVSADCPADPFEDAAKYPGVRSGHRGETLQWNGKDKVLEVGSFYGYATGIIGLRLFPNPDFDQAAADKWKPDQFYSSASYFYDRNLVRPYRVGMSCAFCHVGPNPSRPPSDFNNPKWENLNSNPGAQYFWVDRIFDWDWRANQNSFIVQLLRTSRPGSLDTSLVSSDMINNPRTMNAVYNLPARVAAAKLFNHREQLKGDEVLNAQFELLPSSVVPKASPLRPIYNADLHQVLSPRVLKDGSDSVGALGALNRVYVNIGLFSEEWTKHFIPLVGGPKLTPFPIAVANQKSVYWQSTVNQTPDLALFFLAASRPDKLSQAPGGMSYLKDFNGPDVTLGKKIFARNCAACHSSKLPDKAYTFFNQTDPTACVGAGYLNCWNAYWAYAKTPEFKDAMEPIVADANFLDANYMSTELRVPTNLVDSQLCSPIGTNAIKDNIWDNFSSSSYKSLPSAGQFRVNFPTSADGVMGTTMVTMPDGGRGFFRPASLISVWSTAPFLQNNSLGKFDPHGTVAGRMASFNDSIGKLLNPETRGGDANPAEGRKAVTYTTTFGDQLSGVMDVTTVDSYLKIPRLFLVKNLSNSIRRVLESLPGAKKMIGKDQPLTMRENDSAKKTAAAPKKNWFQRAFASIFGGSNSTDLASNDDSNSALYTSDESGEFYRFGPIPAGVPVNLIANIDLELLNSASTGGNRSNFSDVIFKLATTTSKIQLENLKGPAARDYFMSVMAEPLVSVSRCQDFVVNRGHYFGTKYSPDKGDSGQGLSAQEKLALIEFLKWL